MFNPLSISCTGNSFTELYTFIQYLSLASMTNLHLVLIFSMGSATISLWSWPGNLKCAPTGFTVSLWQGWVTVPKCSLNLFLKGLSVQPMYCGPFTWAHWPDPLSQLTECTTQGVKHDRLELMGNNSPVELQVWLVLLVEWGQTLQSCLWSHLLNPKVAVLLLLDGSGGTLALTRMSCSELVWV